MQIDSSSSSRLLNIPLDKLSTASHLSQAEKISEASRQFEAVLLRQVLAQVQTPAVKSSLFGHSVAGDVYRDLVTQQLAEQISRSGAFGLGHQLEGQLQQQLHPDQPGEASKE
jgi:peptidoglycan hydrolase FlgJ